jgi:hypothetical protein
MKFHRLPLIESGAIVHRLSSVVHGDPPPASGHAGCDRNGCGQYRHTQPHNGRFFAYHHSTLRLDPRRDSHRDPPTPSVYL